MKFKIVSLGCPKNLVESEYIASMLENAGHVVSEDCETLIVNTCAFISDAAQESIETILEEAARNKDRGVKIVVAGCLVERYREKLGDLLPEVDLFVGRNNYSEIVQAVTQEGTLLKEGDFQETFPRKVLTVKPTAYLKIQEGCDNRCSYCTVPSIRGPLRSRPLQDIREEFIWLLEEGFREINIIGQDITSYGKNTGTGLVELLKSLLDVKGDYYLRLLYMHPKGIDDDLIELIKVQDRIIKYMDVPIQHSEERILTAMGRRYTRERLESLLDRIRSTMPDVILRTSLIVGFPGETEEEFTALCDFVRKWEFDMLGAFMYSREEGTPAFRMKGQIKKSVKQERYNRIMEIQKEISGRRLKRLEGRTMKVIIEEKDGEQTFGRLLVQAPDIDGIAFVRGDCNPGELRAGKIVKTLDYDVIVEIV
jgi:ribosomal protein S12 methylthiotransferase